MYPSLINGLCDLFLLHRSGEKKQIDDAVDNDGIDKHGNKRGPLQNGSRFRHIRENTAEGRNKETAERIDKVHKPARGICAEKSKDKSECEQYLQNAEKIPQYVRRREDRFLPFYHRRR